MKTTEKNLLELIRTFVTKKGQVGSVDVNNVFVMMMISKQLRSVAIILVFTLIVLFFLLILKSFNINLDTVYVYCLFAITIFFSVVTLTLYLDRKRSINANRREYFAYEGFMGAVSQFKWNFGEYPERLGVKGVTKRLVSLAKKIIETENMQNDSSEADMARSEMRMLYDTANIIICELQNPTTC